MKLKRNDRRLLNLLIILSGGLLLPATAGASGVETDKSLLDLYREGGPVMHIIALCSVVTLALGTYCGIMYRKARMMPLNYSSPCAQSNCEMIDSRGDAKS